MAYNPQAHTRSVYIHWPFCPYRCHFCPFVALASHDQYMGRYHQALCKEIKAFGAQLEHKLELDTIYMGGGTPSTYPDEALLDMFGTIRDMANFNHNSEVTIEVNPGTVRAEQLTLWRSAGINRISMGVQSLKEKALHALNRMQNTRDVYRLLEQAQGIIDNVSVDFILGLPGVSQAEWKAYLSQVVTWPIKHISMYFLMVHENTPLYFKVKSHMVDLPKDDAVVDLYHWSCQLLREHGFAQYEVSNFAKEGYQSRHNTVYWERKPYKAFGLGACSFDGQWRFQNEKSLLPYLESVDSGKDVTSFCEELTVSQIRLEKIMLGVRRSCGIAWDELVHGLTAQQGAFIAQRVAVLAQRDLLCEQNGRLILTPAGLAIENEIVRQLSL